MTSDAALGACSLAIPPPSAASTWPTWALRYLERELRARGRPVPAVLRRPDDDSEAEADVVGPARCGCSPTRSTPSSRPSGRRRSCATSALAGVLSRMERTIGVDTDRLGELEAPSRARESAQTTRPRGARSARECDLGRQAAAGRALRRGSACPRPSAPRPATPPTRARCSRSTRKPGLAAMLLHRGSATRLKVTVDGLLKAVAADGRIPHDVQPDPRLHRRLSSTDPQESSRSVRSAPKKADGSARRWWVGAGLLWSR